MSQEATMRALTRALEAAQDHIEELEREKSDADGELRLHAGGGDNRISLVWKMIKMIEVAGYNEGFVFFNGDKIRIAAGDTLEDVKARMGWE